MGDQKGAFRASLLSSRIYEPSYVNQLFEEMSRTYGIVNTVASFGFNAHWRKKCVGEIKFPASAVVYDLMTGQGEVVYVLRERADAPAKVVALDISTEMCRRARNALRGVSFQVDVREEDVFDSSLPSEGADVVLCGFGLKTLSIDRRALLAREIYRVLKAGGQFSLVEISVPSFFLLRKLFLFYLRWIIPWIGKLFLGNPDNYRMLSVYTEAFKDCKESLEAFKDAGFDAQVRSYFFGCATAITGFKPR